MLLGGALAAGCTSSGSIGGSGSSGGSSGGSGKLPSGKFTTAQAFDSQHISWGACTSAPPDDPTADLSGFQCGSVVVPLDYANPAGKDVTLALVKWPAANQANKVGSLLTNPGGPGASGVDFVEEAKKQFDGTLHANFDVIGMDPRGLGHSEPIK